VINRCIFKDLPLLDDFVSNLLYPAILGSLIYDIVKEFDDFNFNLNFDPDKCIHFIFLLITAFFYIVDYLYMHYAFKLFKSDENKESIVEIKKTTRTRHMIFFAFKVYKSDEVKISIIENKETTRTGCMIWLDILDTLSFAAIIILINKSCYDFIIFPTMLIFLVEANYLKDSGYKEMCLKKRIIYFIFILIGALILYFIFYILNLDCYSNWVGYLMIEYLLLVFAYTILAYEFYKDNSIKNE